MSEELESFLELGNQTVSPNAENLTISTNKAEPIQTLTPPDTVYEELYPYAKNAEEVLSSLSIDCRNYSTIEQALEAVKPLLEQNGAVILENTPLKDLAELRGWGMTFGSPMDYIGGTNDRASQGNQVLTVGTEPPWANVSAHVEMCYSSWYPETFMIGCTKAPYQTGATVVADNVAITQSMLKTEVGQKLKRLGVRYIRNFHDRNTTEEGQATFTSWQQTFGTESLQEAIQNAQSRLGGSDEVEVEVLASNALRIYYNAPAYEYDADTGEDVSFFSIGNHGYWFRGWAPYNLMPNIERPFHLQFGDGTELSEAELATIAEINNQHGYPIYWQPGKVAILKNRRFTHARPIFELAPGDQRELGVVLLNPTQKVGPFKTSY